MRLSQRLLAGAGFGLGALALFACGGEDEAAAPKTATTAAAAKVDAASPLEKPFSLKGGEAVDIDGLLTLMPSDKRPTYESAAFDPDIGATVVSNLRFADAADGEALVVKRAEFFGVNQKAIERIQNAEDAGADAPMEKIFEKVRFLNISTEGFETDDGEMARINIGGVEFDGLSVRQGGVIGNPDGSGPANFANAFSLGGLYFKDIDVAVTGDEAMDLALTAPDLRFVGIGGGKLDAIIGNDFSYRFVQGETMRTAMRESMGPQGEALLDGPLGGLIAPESQRADLETLEWRGIDLSGLVEYGLRGEEPPLDARGLIDLGEFRMTNMVNYIEDRRVASVDETKMTAADFAGMIPSHFRFETSGGNYDLTAYAPGEDHPAYAVMKERGLDEVTGDGFVEWKWNPDNGNGAFDYVANSDGLMDLTMSMELAGDALNALAASAAAGEESPFMKNAALKSFNFAIDDETALDAIFAVAALQMGGTGEDLRQSAPAMIRLAGAQGASIHPRIKDYVEAVANFVAEGGTLTVSANPDEPVGMTALETGEVDPQTLPDMLDLKFTHEK